MKIRHKLMSALTAAAVLLIVFGVTALGLNGIEQPVDDAVLSRPTATDTVTRIGGSNAPTDIAVTGGSTETRTYAAGGHDLPENTEIYVNVDPNAFVPWFYSTDEVVFTQPDGAYLHMDFNCTRMEAGSVLDVPLLGSINELGLQLCPECFTLSGMPVRHDGETACLPYHNISGQESTLAEAVSGGLKLCGKCFLEVYTAPGNPYMHCKAECTAEQIKKFIHGASAAGLDACPVCMPVKVDPVTGITAPVIYSIPMPTPSPEEFIAQNPDWPVQQAHSTPTPPPVAAQPTPEAKHSDEYPPSILDATAAFYSADGDSNVHVSPSCGGENPVSLLESLREGKRICTECSGRVYVLIDTAYNGVPTGGSGYTTSPMTKEYFHARSECKVAEDGYLLRVPMPEALEKKYSPCPNCFLDVYIQDDTYHLNSDCAPGMKQHSYFANAVWDCLACPLCVQPYSTAYLEAIEVAATQEIDGTAQPGSNEPEIKPKEIAAVLGSLADTGVTLYTDLEATDGIYHSRISCQYMQHPYAISYADMFQNAYSVCGWCLNLDNKFALEVNYAYLPETPMALAGINTLQEAVEATVVQVVDGTAQPTPTPEDYVPSLHGIEAFYSSAEDAYVHIKADCSAIEGKAAAVSLFQSMRRELKPFCSTCCDNVRAYIDPLDSTFHLLGFCCKYPDFKEEKRGSSQTLGSPCEICSMDVYVDGEKIHMRAGCSALMGMQTCPLGSAIENGKWFCGYCFQPDMLRKINYVYTDAFHGGGLSAEEAAVAHADRIAMLEMRSQPGNICFWIDAADPYYIHSYDWCEKMQQPKEISCREALLSGYGACTRCLEIDKTFEDWIAF